MRRPRTKTRNHGAAARGPPGLAAVLDERVELLRGLVRRAPGSWDTEGIHRARVTTRRLKAAIDLLEPFLPDEPRREFARALRKLRRTLGPLRDLDVMLQHLADMKVPARRAEGAAWVAERFGERRVELRRESARAMTPRRAVSRLEAWVELENEVRAAQASAGPLIARAAPQQLRDFATRADRIARDARTATSADDTPVGPEDSSSDDVHELRVAGKLLRYTLELAEPLGYAVPGSVAKEFKKLQEALGLWHDYVVLTNEMLRLAIDAELATRHPHVYGQVLELARGCWGRSERHLDQFRKLWTKGGVALAERVAGVFACQPAAAAPPPADLGPPDAPAAAPTGEQSTEAAEA